MIALVIFAMYLVSFTSIWLGQLYALPRLGFHPLSFWQVVLLAAIIYTGKLINVLLNRQLATAVKKWDAR